MFFLEIIISWFISWLGVDIRSCITFKENVKSFLEYRLAKLPLNR